MKELTTLVIGVVAYVVIAYLWQDNPPNVIRLTQKILHIDVSGRVQNASLPGFDKEISIGQVLGKYKYFSSVNWLGNDFPYGHVEIADRDTTKERENGSGLRYAKATATLYNPELKKYLSYRKRYKDENINMAANFYFQLKTDDLIELVDCSVSVYGSKSGNIAIEKIDVDACLGDMEKIYNNEPIL